MTKFFFEMYGVTPYVLERYKHRAVDTLVLEGKTSQLEFLRLHSYAVDTLVLEGKTSS